MVGGVEEGGGVAPAAKPTAAGLTSGDKGGNPGPVPRPTTEAGKGLQAEMAVLDERGGAGQKAETAVRGLAVAKPGDECLPLLPVGTRAFGPPDRKRHEPFLADVARRGGETVPGRWRVESLPGRGRAGVGEDKACVVAVGERGAAAELTVHQGGKLGRIEVACKVTGGEAELSHGLEVQFLARPAAGDKGQVPCLGAALNKVFRPGAGFGEQPEHRHGVEGVLHRGRQPAGGAETALIFLKGSDIGDGPISVYRLHGCGAPSLGFGPPAGLSECPGR